MRQYYEAREIVVSDIKGEFIRIDITDMTKTNRVAVLVKIKAVMGTKHYKLYEHDCYHDERKPCPPLREIK